MTIRKTKGLYEVKVMIQYKNIIVGYFKTEDEAKEEYNKFIEKNNLNRKKMTIRILSHNNMDNDTYT